MIRLPLVLVASVLGGLAIVGVYEWFGSFVAGLVLVLVIATWFEIRLSKATDHVVDLEETLGHALDGLKAALEALDKGRCGELPPLAYPGQPGTVACILTHGHASEWHRGPADRQGLPGMEWRDRPELAYLIDGVHPRGRE